MPEDDRVDPLLTGRNETPLQRCDRNLVELLQEVRVAQTGVQVLFAFLLMAPLTPNFHRLGAARPAEDFVTLALAGLAAGLPLPPATLPPPRFPGGGRGEPVAPP